MSLRDESGFEAELTQLRQALARAQRAARKKELATEELVGAVYAAAKDAFLAHGPAPVVPPAGKDKRKARAEVALLHLTDWQVGKVSRSYSMEVCRRRVMQAVTKTCELADIQRSHHPVHNVDVMLGGDMVEGITVFPGQAFEVEAAAFEQMVFTAKLIESVVSTLAQHFQTVTVWEEIGNHGRIGRKGESPHGDNHDRMAYTLARSAVTNVPSLNRRVVWNPWAGGLGTHVKVGNYTALLFHGDEIKSFGGNCVTPDVRVLTRDLRWIPAGELQVGDRLLAFTEDGAPVRKYCDAQVTATGIHEREVYRITFDDGSFVRCTPEHPWIVSQTDRPRGGTNRQIWMTPVEIAERLATGGRAHTGAGVWMFQPIAPWDQAAPDYDAGLLAGAFDADGCLSKGRAHPRWPTAGFAQYPNVLLDAVKTALGRKGFEFKERTKKVKNGRRGDIHNLDLNGRDTTLRFLGQVRPPRLLDWWMNKIDISQLTFTRKSSSGLKRIVSCVPDGRTDICALTTSSATYITEHGPAHNTPAFGILRKLNAWATGVIEPFQDAYGGHFHTPMTLTMANAGRIFITGSPESDNEYAREFVAAVGKPSQRLNFVDPAAGRVAAEYTLWLD